MNQKYSEGTSASHQKSDALPGCLEIDDYIMRLIRYRVMGVIQSTLFTKSDEEDLIQDVVLHLIQCPEHDPEKGTRKTYIDRIIKRQLASQIRWRYAACRYAKTHSIDQALDAERRGLGVNSESAAMLDELTYDNEEAKIRAADVAGFLKSLPPKLREVAEAVSGTPSLKKAAMHLEINAKTLRWHLEKLRERMQKAGLEKLI